MSRFKRPGTSAIPFLVLSTSILLASLLGLPACQADYAIGDLNAAYTAAVADAADAQPWEISHNLTAIVPHNKDLIWRNGPGSRVLVATWADSDKYYRANVYRFPNAYPWTRLGYTYDWGNARNHVGPSEFLLTGSVKGGVTVGIKSITDTAAYFAR